MNSTQTTLTPIIFDFGGVLVDWDPRYLYRPMFADDAAMEQFFDEVHFGEWNYEQDKGRTFAQAVIEHSAKFPHRADLLRAYNECWEESVGGEIAGTVEILRKLKQAGYPLYGLSNWANEKFVLVRDRYDFFNLFDGILISSEVRLAKPDPRIFELMLEQIGRPAAECLFIDDAPKNITVAQALGFQTIRFTSPEQLASELHAMGILFQGRTA